jgi:hypothetical protein
MKMEKELNDTMEAPGGTHCGQGVRSIRQGRVKFCWSTLEYKQADACHVRT